MQSLQVWFGPSELKEQKPISLTKVRALAKVQEHDQESLEMAPMHVILNGVKTMVKWAVK